MAIHFGDTAPPAGAPGDMWWTGGKLALAIDDLTSLQWVQISAVSDTTIAGPWDFPDAPANGAQFIPSGGSATLTWDGQMWTYPMAAGSSGITVADAPPTGAPPNGLWWDSDSGNLFLNYNDADSTQWVQININAPPTTGIAEAPTDGQQYTRGSSTWSVASATGMSQADADLRYLQLTAPPTAPVTGALTVQSQHPALMLRSTSSTGGFPSIGIYHNNVQPNWNFDFNDTSDTGNLRLGHSPGSPPAPGSMLYCLTVNRQTGVFDFATTPTRAGSPLALGSQMTEMEERLVARICLLEERLAKMEAR